MKTTGATSYGLDMLTKYAEFILPKGSYTSGKALDFAQVIGNSDTDKYYILDFKVKSDPLDDEYRVVVLQSDYDKMSIIDKTRVNFVAVTTKPFLYAVQLWDYLKQKYGDDVKFFVIGVGGLAAGVLMPPALYTVKAAGFVVGTASSAYGAYITYKKMKAD